MEEPNPLKIFENDPSSVININDGKLPPQAIDLEEAVIGAMLIDEKGVDEVIEILIPEVFYKKSHQLIFESIERLFRNSEPIDLLTVSADLKKNKTLKNIGGEYYLIELSQKVSSSAHIEFHARIIQQKFIQRKLIKISNEVIQKAYNESTDVIDLLDEAESKLYDITQRSIKNKKKPVILGGDHSISLATVTPSLVRRGAPKDLSKRTFLPFGPRVTLTAFEREFTPLSSFSRFSAAKITCFAIPFL